MIASERRKKECNTTPRPHATLRCGWVGAVLLDDDTVAFDRKKIGKKRLGGKEGTVGTLHHPCVQQSSTTAQLRSKP